MSVMAPTAAVSISGSLEWSDAALAGGQNPFRERSSRQPTFLQPRSNRPTGLLRRNLRTPSWLFIAVLGLVLAPRGILAVIFMVPLFSRPIRDVFASSCEGLWRDPPATRRLRLIVAIIVVAGMLTLRFLYPALWG